MKLCFEKRLREKEIEYKEKYNNKIAYDKLKNKYQRYIDRINFSFFYILVFSVLFLARLFNITILNQNDSVDIYSAIYLATLGSIVFLHLFAYILYHVKYKNLIRRKMEEWDRYLNDGEN